MHEPKDRGQSTETDELPREARGSECAVRTGGGDAAGAGSALAAAGLVRQFGCGNEDVAGVRSPEVRTVASLIHLPGSKHLAGCLPVVQKGSGRHDISRLPRRHVLGETSGLPARSPPCDARHGREAPEDAARPAAVGGHGDAEVPQSAAGAVSRIGGSSQGRRPHAKGRAVLGPDHPGNGRNLRLRPFLPTIS